jgi:hypothetical protein
MGSVNWNPILSAAKLLGTVVVILGVIAIVIVGGASQTKRRIAKYKKSGRFLDLLNIFSRY